MFGVILLKIQHECLFFYSEYHICKTKSDVESPGEEELTPLFRATDLNQMESNKKGIYHESLECSFFI